MVLVPTMKAAALHARVVLAAMSLAALLVLAWTLASPVAAQGGPTAQDGEKASASSCSAGADEVATFTTKDDSFGPFRITDESFDVLYEARADRDSRSFRVAVTEDGETVTETATITELPANDVLEVEDEGPGSFSLKVRASKGIDFAITVCEAGKTEDGGDGSANGEDDLNGLSCDELLVLFRSENSQYQDADDLADSDVRARIELCLKQEIVQGTAADGNLPDTGGLSLIGLAALGAAAAVVGLSVIRGGRR